MSVFYFKAFSFHMLHFMAYSSAVCAESPMSSNSQGVRLYFQDVPNSQRNFGIFRCCSSWISQFFPVHKKDLFFFFFESKPRLYFQIFPNSPKIWETGIFEVPSYSHLLSLKPFSYSETMGWKQGWEISKEFCRKNI